MKEIEIKDDFIKLGQLLKLAGILYTGSQAKDFLYNNNVIVNGSTENRRGAKIHPGDIVKTEGYEPIIVKSKKA